MEWEEQKAERKGYKSKRENLKHLQKIVFLWTKTTNVPS